MTNPICKQCGEREVEDARVCSATPTCYACLPPPEPLPIVPASGPTAPEQRDPAVEAIAEQCVEDLMNEGLSFAVVLRAVEATLRLAEERGRTGACCRPGFPRPNCLVHGVEAYQRIVDAKAEGAREEREACARALDKRAAWARQQMERCPIPSPERAGWSHTAIEASDGAAAIRARGDQ